MYITLDEAKAHCRVDIEDDDNYITELIDVAEQVISNEISDNLADVAVGGILPSALKQAVLLTIGHFYNTRESVVYGTTPSKVPMTVDYLIAPYKNWTCV